MHHLVGLLRESHVQAALVFLAGYVFVCVSRRFRATALWACVALLLLLGVYAPSAQEPGLLPSAGNVLSHINWNVLMILAGAMAVAELFVMSKVPVLLADLIVIRLRTVGGAALGVCAMASLLSTFLDNVTTVLIVAPVAIELARRLDASPAPFIISIAISSNLQGMATLIGDPPSLILASWLKMNFLDFFVFRGRPGLFWVVQMGGISSMLLLWFAFFRKYKAPAAKPTLTRPETWFPTCLLAAMVVALSVVSQVADRIPGGTQFANGAVCLAAALVGIVWHARRGVRETVKMVLRVDLQTVALLGGVFALTFALSETGFIAQIADLISGIVGTNRFLAFTLIVWISIAFSAFVDNIPYTAVMMPTVLRIADAFPGGPGITNTHVLFAFGLMIGACLGGNITPVGASANIVGVGLLRRRGYATGFWDFVKIGLPFTIAATIPAQLLIWWIWS